VLPGVLTLTATKRLLGTATRAACLSANTMTTKKHEVPQELLASLLADYKKPEDLIGVRCQHR